MKKKYIVFIIKTFFVSIIPFSIVTLILHLKPTNGIDFSPNIFDLFNMINLILFFYVKWKLLSKKQQKDIAMSQEVEMSAYQDTTRTTFITYETFNKNVSILESCINNIFIYIFSMFIFLYYVIKKLIL